MLGAKSGGLVLTGEQYASGEWPQIVSWSAYASNATRTGQWPGPACVLIGERRLRVCISLSLCNDSQTSSEHTAYSWHFLMILNV